MRVLWKQSIYEIWKNSDKKNEVVDTDRRWPFLAILLINQQITKRVRTFIFLSFGIMGFIVEL